MDPNIERIVNSNVPASEQIIWTDVSLKSITIVTFFHCGLLITLYFQFQDGVIY